MRNCCVFRICGVLAGLVLVSSLYAQEKDFATWTSAGVEYKVNPAFALSGSVEWRTKDNLSKTNRWGADVGGEYVLFPFLKAEAGYEIHYRNRGEAGWKFRHRYHAGGTLSARLQRLKLSLRERFQHTIEGSRNEFRMRSRIKLAYDVPKSKLEPYASVEMYNGLDRGDNFDVRRMRYRGGIVLPLSSRWEADLFYCRQWEQDERKNIAGLACTYTF